MNVWASQSSPAEAVACFKETSVEGGHPVLLNLGDERVPGDVQRDEVEILWMSWLE